MSALDNYQGYANVETWALCLHINNNQDLQMEVQELLMEAQYPHEALKNWYEDICYNFWGCDLYQENAYRHIRMMIQEVGTYKRVDWREAAENIMPED